MHVQRDALLGSDPRVVSQFGIEFLAELGQLRLVAQLALQFDPGADRVRVTRLVAGRLVEPAVAQRSEQPRVGALDRVIVSLHQGIVVATRDEFNQSFNQSWRSWAASSKTSQATCEPSAR